ncbi:MAG: SufE family protein [Proteobacteria bacterium]|nr:SufE family protein [Pseudomonadota bacterium]
MKSRNLSELADAFALFDNWEDKYAYLIDLGERLPSMDESQKTEENIVRGCTSRVWLIAAQKDGKFHFSADSDAKIVRGLIYILLSAYQGRSAAEIAAVDIRKSFEQIGLHQHLSPNRRNGFFAMVDRIKRLAAAA